MTENDLRRITSQTLRSENWLFVYVISPVLSNCSCHVRPRNYIGLLFVGVGVRRGARTLSCYVTLPLSSSVLGHSTIKKTLEGHYVVSGTDSSRTPKKDDSPLCLKRGFINLSSICSGSTRLQGDF